MKVERPHLRLVSGGRVQALLSADKRERIDVNPETKNATIAPTGALSCLPSCCLALLLHAGSGVCCLALWTHHVCLAVRQRWLPLEPPSVLPFSLGSINGAAGLQLLNWFHTSCYLAHRTYGSVEHLDLFLFPQIKFLPKIEKLQHCFLSQKSLDPFW